MDQASITWRGVYHLKTETFFKVDFPLRVIGIGRASDFEVSLDGSVGGQTQSNLLPFFVLAYDCSCKYPVSSAVGGEVFLPSPSGTFLRVFTLTPSPEHPEDVRINLPKGLLAYYVPVVVGPAFDHRVEPLYQKASR
jgi:hypothetical protein